MSAPSTNVFSPTWYETFLAPIAADATRVEVEFVSRRIPLASHPALLDLCCGPARHARALVERGYRVHGIDANAEAIQRARETCPGATFEVGDMRSLASHRGAFDALINLWHSFGYFDDETNLDVLRQIRAALRPGGIAIIDLYNREHFARLPAVDVSERAGRVIRTTRSWIGPRHRVALEYGGEAGDTFEWRLYAPAEFRLLCAGVGLDAVGEFAWFDEAKRPSAEHARMQFVLAARAD